MSVDIRKFLTACVVGASAPAVALIAATSASADPVPPLPPPPPAPVADVTAQAAGGQPPTPPDGIPHLASPDALPPGATMDPSVVGNESPNVSYLKDLWHAVQNQEISGGEALLLGLAQRGMDTPYPEQAPGPNVPVSPADPALAPPPPPPPAPPAPALPWLLPPAG